LPADGLTRRVHGGPDGAELGRLGLDADEILDFSVNVNPHGADPAMLRAIAAARLDRYPDARAPGPRAALAAAWNVPPDTIAIGNGAAELLWTLCHMVARHADRARRSLVVVDPAFCEPALAAQAVGLDLHRFTTMAADGFAIDVAALIRFARAHAAGAIYLASPQNPTGRLVPTPVLAEIARGLPDVTVIVDEAFLALSHGWAEARVPLPDNVVRVRSLTKEHALPGLRVGALLGPPAVIDALEALRPAWTVSAPALAAAEAAAGLEAFVAGVRARWLGETAALVAEVAALGLRVLPTDTVFALVEVADATRLRATLLAQARVLVRDCSSFGLPGHIRIGGRDGADRHRLVTALRAAM
jgi:histidinol-phosphate/aromatic aminotransferase/cobyric acid decarboxylase-like protein